MNLAAQTIDERAWYAADLKACQIRHKHRALKGEARYSAYARELSGLGNYKLVTQRLYEREALFIADYIKTSTLRLDKFARHKKVKALLGNIQHEKIKALVEKKLNVGA